MYVPKFELAKESEMPHVDIVVVLNGKHGIFITVYRIAGNFGKVFNLAIWQIQYRSSVFSLRLNSNRVVRTLQHYH
jgi:hypothetical protein